jgi:DNA topoisomerase-1
MGKNLVIVESPAKAKTIEKYLGKDFKVKSSFGHIRDLVKGDFGVDIEKGYLPMYEVPADKKKVVADLKEEVKKADVVWLASDEDREGEAISWHLAEVLDLDQSKTKRIVFNEITKTAILKAIENPRFIDYNLVNAQQARRVLDRLVGFELSPVLWKKVKPQLSAGRVQSVAVRLLVEREKEIQNFNSVSSFRIVSDFQTSDSKKFKAVLLHKPENEKSARSLLEQFKVAQFKVSSVEVKPSKRNPAAPFTTSTLQQEASRKLGYGVTRTMTLAQKLYENGHITYMRTDSTNLSETAFDASKTKIIEEFGKEYHQRRQYANKNENAQEAHEAIRPTDFNVQSAGEDPAQKRLYQLIWKRTVASQMASADLERTIINVENNQNSEIFQAKGEVIKFDGFLKLYLESSDEDDTEDESGLLPAMKGGDTVISLEIEAMEKYSKPAPRYSEASLVKKLEELGIGRPSTYAPTITTIQKRGYVLNEPIEGKERVYAILKLKEGKIETTEEIEITGADTNKLYPSEIGRIVTEFLVEHFEQVMDYGFTASVEKQFDEIAEGLKDWSNMIDSFYIPFHKNVEFTLENAERASGERLLGVHPENGRNVFVRVGRFGPMAQIGDPDDEDKKFATLQKNHSLETVTLEEVLDLFKLPRKLGLFEDTEIQVNVGRFGPFIMHNKKFVSLPKDEELMEISYDRCVELIIEKRKSDDERRLKTFDEDPDLFVLNGRWGPYIRYKKMNVKIPKDMTVDQITHEVAKDLIANHKPASPRRGNSKSK